MNDATEFGRCVICGWIQAWAGADVCCEQCGECEWEYPVDDEGNPMPEVKA